MIKSGLKPIKPDRRDYDFHKSFGSVPTTLPDNYSADANIWVPNQDLPNDSFSPPIPALPTGCTDYAQTDLCIDEDGVLLNPMLIENVTHANANGGCDLRVSLSAAKKVFNRTGYFNIRWESPLDAFDAIRLALYSTATEKRSASVGSPFFSEWLSPVNGLLPIPSSFSTRGATWHNYKVPGWKTINGVPYLVCKMWLGPTYGDSGYVYMSRELCNAVLNIPGSAAFTLSKVIPGQIQLVDLSIVQNIVSFIRNLLGL